MFALAGCERKPPDEGTTLGTVAEARARASATRQKPVGAPPEALDVQAIKRAVVHLSQQIGPRVAASPQLHTAAQFVASALAHAGYDVDVLTFEVPDGGTSRTVVASTSAPGPRLVLAAHIDTVRDCPGANDDATGVAVIMEVARILSARRLLPDVPAQFVFLGAEEEIPGYEGHGYSAVKLLEQLPAEEQDRMAAAVYLDKLGRGNRYLALYVEEAGDAAATMFRRAANGAPRRPKVVSVDPWSEAMAFEDAGIPIAWVEWARDDRLHQPTDLPDSLDWHKVALVAEATLNLALSKTWLQRPSHVAAREAN